MIQRSPITLGCHYKISLDMPKIMHKHLEHVCIDSTSNDKKLLSLFDIQVDFEHDFCTLAEDFYVLVFDLAFTGCGEYRRMWMYVTASCKSIDIRTLIGLRWKSTRKSKMLY